MRGRERGAKPMGLWLGGGRAAEQQQRRGNEAPPLQRRERADATPHQTQPYESSASRRVSHLCLSLLCLGKVVGVRKKTGLLFAWMILGVLLVGSLPVDALQLAKVEAEQATVGTWGAVVNDTTASGGKALRWNKPGTTGTLDFTISEPADSVTVYIKEGSNSTSRVCVRPTVDNTALGTQ